MAPTSTQYPYTLPIDSARPKGASRFEFWAPKIGRTVTLFNPVQVRFWTLLESIPSISAYCERPVFWKSDSGRQLIDFWVKTGRRETCWIIGADVRRGRAGTLSTAESIEVRYIQAESLASRSVWIENWMRILPYLAANARFVTDRLLTDIERTSRAAPTLGEIEREFQPYDIVLVRTAAFMLLHQGRINANALREHPLSPSTVFRRSLT